MTPMLLALVCVVGGECWREWEWPPKEQAVEVTGLVSHQASILLHTPLLVHNHKGYDVIHDCARVRGGTHRRMEAGHGSSTRHRGLHTSVCIQYVRSHVAVGLCDSACVFLV